MEIAHLHRGAVEQLEQPFTPIADNTLDVDSSAGNLFYAGKVKLVAFRFDILFEKYFT